MFFSLFGADSASSIPDVLQEAEITVFTLEECEDAYSEPAIEDNEHVCVGVLGEKGSCNVSVAYWRLIIWILNLLPSI